MKIVNNTKKDLEIKLTRRIDEHPTTKICLEAGKETFSFEGVKVVEIWEYPEDD